MSHAGYDPILEQYEKAKYINLDEFYGRVTFIQEGPYYYRVKGKRVDAFQSGRKAKKLKLPI